jgi:hypothetical protein
MKNGAGTGGHDGNSRSLGRDHACEHARAGEHHRRAQLLAEHERGPEDGQQRLGELDLADARDAAAGQPRVPGEEAEEHGERGDVGESRPGLRGRRQASERDGH